LVEAGGSNLQSSVNTGVATSVQAEASAGQGGSQGGQRDQVGTSAAGSNGAKPGQDGHEAGRVAAPTEPPLELRFVLEAWPKLPDAVRFAIASIIAAVVAREREEEA